MIKYLSELSKKGITYKISPKGKGDVEISIFKDGYGITETIYAKEINDSEDKNLLSTRMTAMVNKIDDHIIDLEFCIGLREGEVTTLVEEVPFLKKICKDYSTESISTYFRFNMDGNLVLYIIDNATADVLITRKFKEYPAGSIVAYIRSKAVKAFEIALRGQKGSNTDD